MSDYPSITCVLYGTKDDGTPSAVGLHARTVGRISRSIGLQGDALQLLCPRTFPVEWNRTKPFRIVFGDTVTTMTLGGYMLRRASATNWGHPFNPPPPPPPPPLPSAPAEHFEAVCIFETIPGLWRDGAGGIMIVGTLNPLGADGRVDDTHDDYMNNQTLVDNLLDSLNFAHDPAPAGLNTAIDGVTTLIAAGPLDWGNARALPELEALLAQLGWTAVFANDGSKVSVIRLMRSGEIFTPPSLIVDNAEAYILDDSQAVRPSKIVVTSGRTRTTIISERTFGQLGEIPLVWVSLSEVTGRWLLRSESDQLDAFKAGPVGADETTRLFSKSFTAVRLGAVEIPTHSQFVTLPEAAESAAYAGFALSPCMVFLRGCVLEPGGEYVNAPLDVEDDLLAVEGAQAIVGEGVFILPTSIRAVRMPEDDNRGAHMDAIALEDGDIVVRFSHEAHTGDHVVDYYVSGWESSVSMGVISVTQLLGLDLIDALEDPLVLKLEAPFLRRLMVWDMGAADPDPINDADLNEIAKQIALSKVADASARSGRIVLRGTHDVPPGYASGAVSAVEWSYDGGHTTTLFINQHELPGSFWDELNFQAGRSIAAGLDRYTLGGSSAALAEVRAGSTPGDFGGVYGGGGTRSPEAVSGSRGREAAIVHEASKKSMPHANGVLPSRVEASERTVLITGHDLVGGETFLDYRWKEAKWDFVEDRYVEVLGGLTSTTHGKARNLSEMEGVQLPVRDNTVVRLTGPRRTLGSSTWFFSHAGPKGLKARLNGRTLIPGQDFGWTYTWSEVEHTEGGWQHKIDGLSYLTPGLGQAKNFNEHAYGPTIPPFFAPGYDPATIPVGFEPVAIRGSPIVELEGPYLETIDELLKPFMYFRAENAVDGECPAV